MSTPASGQSAEMYSDVPGGSYVRGYYGVPAHKGGRIHFEYNTRPDSGDRALPAKDGAE